MPKKTINEDTGVKMTEPDVSVPPQSDDDELMLTKGQIREKLKKEYLSGGTLQNPAKTYVQLAEKYDLTVEQVKDVLMDPAELAKERGQAAPGFIPGRD